MIFEDDVFYSLKPDAAPKNQTFWHKWYTTMTEPLAVLSLMIACFALFRQTITTALSKGSEKGSDDSLLFMLLLLTFAIGWRLIHSLYWAKKDYSRLEFGIGDVLTLLVFIFFTTGMPIILFADYPETIIAIYACLCMVGFWHFRGLARWRISSDTRNYDLPIEIRIQTVNTWVFGVLAVNFGAAFALMLAAPSIDRVWVCLALSPILIAVLINIHHSHTMSDWPKALISNRYLAPDKLVERLEAIVGVDDQILAKRGVVSALKDYHASYRRLVVRRARKLDIELITKLYIRDFSYVLTGIFDDVGKSHTELMARLLRSSYGLGLLGYLRFFIIEIDGKAVGMLMPEFRSEPRLYSVLDYFSLGQFLIRKVGVSGLFRVLRNLRALRALQPRPGSKELRINYVSIADDEQRKGNAARVITLLQQAFVHSSTNGFQAQCITAFVREGNAGSIALFEDAGFSREEIDADPANDPTRGEGRGLIRFIFTSDRSGKPASRRLAANRHAALRANVSANAAISN